MNVEPGRLNPPYRWPQPLKARVNASEVLGYFPSLTEHPIGGRRQRGEESRAYLVSREWNQSLLESVSTESPRSKDIIILCRCMLLQHPHRPVHTKSVPARYMSDTCAIHVHPWSHQRAGLAGLGWAGYFVTFSPAPYRFAEWKTHSGRSGSFIGLSAKR